MYYYIYSILPYLLTVLKEMRQYLLVFNTGHIILAKFGIREYDSLTGAYSPYNKENYKKEDE